MYPNFTPSANASAESLVRLVQTMWQSLPSATLGSRVGAAYPGAMGLTATVMNRFCCLSTAVNWTPCFSMVS